MMVSAKRLKKLSNREYRDEYLKSTVTGWVIHQLRVLRKQRDWTQEDLGTASGKSQSAIARFESESYGNWNANTLLELAHAFDVAIDIRFVSWPDFLKRTSDTSPERMYVPSFSEADFHLPDKSFSRLNEITALESPRSQQRSRSGGWQPVVEPENEFRPWEKDRGGPERQRSAGAF